MGWAGPAQPTGPDSAQKCWADFGPKMDWADLGPTEKLISPSGPGPTQKARLGQDPPGPATKTGGGNYFPPTPACRTLFVLHAEKEKINARMRGKTSYLARGRLCVAGGAAAEAGGGVVAHGRRLQVALQLFRTSGGVTVFSPVFYPFPAFPFLFLCFGLLLFSSLPSLLSVCFSFLCFFMFFSPLGFSLLSVLPPFFSVFRFFSSSSFPPAFLGSIYRAKGVAFYCSHGEQPAGRPLGATAKVRPPSPVFWQVRGGWSASVFGRWAPGERGAGKKIQIKASFFLLPRCMFGGKKKEEQCRSK